MRAYLGKQHQNATDNVTHIQGTLLQLVKMVVDAGHNLYMDNYFTSPDLILDLCTADRLFAVTQFSIMGKEFPQILAVSP
jgi:hypothetical protein